MGWNRGNAFQNFVNLFSCLNNDLLQGNFGNKESKQGLIFENFGVVLLITISKKYTCKLNK